MEFREIIPANRTVALSRSVASILGLVLDGKTLTLVKYTEKGSIIWVKFLGEYGNNIPDEFSLKEDEKGIIHVVTGFNGVFKPYYDDAVILSVRPTLVLMLDNTGKIVSNQILFNLYSNTLVKIKNDVWMVSNSITETNTTSPVVYSISMRNLSTGGNIRNIFVNGPTSILNAHHVGEKLFLLGSVNGDTVTYKGKVYKLGNKGAILLILETDLWSLWDYFMAVPMEEKSVVNTPDGICKEGDESTNDVPFITFETMAGGLQHYFLAGKTSNTNRITIYHRKKLIDDIGLTVKNTIMLYRFTPTIKNEKIRNISFESFHLPSEYQGKLQMIMTAKDGNLLLKGFENGDVLYRFVNELVNKKPEILHNENVMFVLRFSQNLKVVGHTFIGTPSLGQARVCGCTDCRGQYKGERGMILPCIPMRLFAPGPTNIPFNCSDVNCQAKFTLDVNAESSKIYTCQNAHCSPAQGAPRQAGNLYNTKYNQDPCLVVNIASANNPNADSVNNQMIEIEDNTSIIIANTLIDKLLINGDIKKSLYKERWYGFMLFFDYS